MTQGMLRAANGCPSSVYDMPNVSLHRAPWLDPEGGSGWGVGGGGGSADKVNVAPLGSSKGVCAVA